MAFFLRGPSLISGLLAAILLLPVANPLPAAESAPAGTFSQSVALASAGDSAADGAMAEFYRARGYAPLWTGVGERFRARRQALFDSLGRAALHGLPVERHDTAELLAQMRDARDSRDLGAIEVALSRAFLRYARDVQSGLLVPGQIDSGLVREVARPDPLVLLRGFAKAESAAGFLAALAPAAPEYRALMKARLDLETAIAAGGWGPGVPEGPTLRPGESGERVIALRNRLVAMGYMKRSASPDYDAALQEAVQRFQDRHGLAADGIAGPVTVTEVNVPMEQRLKSVLVALERERWLNMDRGERHILVNMTDFTTRIVDHGEVTFETRSVIGMNADGRRSPEFSDEMSHMVVNPTWYVPRSIVTQEYLPQLRRNPYAVSHLVITDSSGRQIDRRAVDFTQYTARNFPFSMREPPSQRNALGQVKFMFPNKYNIYLHDTPSKSLFDHDARAFSHGCIRLADPVDFAKALLAPQTDDPEGLFRSRLNTGRETRINIEPPVPVHLIYRTAFTDGRGGLEFRRDVYGRDARIWEALERAGVALPEVRG